MGHQCVAKQPINASVELKFRDGDGTAGEVAEDRLMG